MLEEYSIAAQIYKLSPADMCELARNSVIQSGWEMEIKRSVDHNRISAQLIGLCRRWIGEDFYLPGADGNDVVQTNVPDVRMKYRSDTLREERDLVSILAVAEVDAYHDIQIWRNSVANRQPKPAPAPHPTEKARKRSSMSGLRNLHLTANEDTLGAAAMKLA